VLHQHGCEEKSAPRLPTWLSTDVRELTRRGTGTEPEVLNVASGSIGAARRIEISNVKMTGDIKAVTAVEGQQASGRLSWRPEGSSGERALQRRTGRPAGTSGERASRRQRGK